MAEQSGGELSLQPGDRCPQRHRPGADGELGSFPLSVSSSRMSRPAKRKATTACSPAAGPGGVPSPTGGGVTHMVVSRRPSPRRSSASRTSGRASRTRTSRPRRRADAPRCLARGRATAPALRCGGRSRPGSPEGRRPATFARPARARARPSRPRNRRHASACLGQVLGVGDRLPLERRHASEREPARAVGLAAAELRPPGLEDDRVGGIVGNRERELLGRRGSRRRLGLHAGGRGGVAPGAGDGLAPPERRTAWPQEAAGAWRPAPGRAGAGAPRRGCPSLPGAGALHLSAAGPTPRPPLPDGVPAVPLDILGQPTRIAHRTTIVPLNRVLVSPDAALDHVPTRPPPILPHHSRVGNPNDLVDRKGGAHGVLAARLRAARTDQPPRQLADADEPPRPALRHGQRPRVRRATGPTPPSDRRGRTTHVRTEMKPRADRLLVISGSKRTSGHGGGRPRGALRLLLRAMAQRSGRGGLVAAPTTERSRPGIHPRWS